MTISLPLIFLTKGAQGSILILSDGQTDISFSAYGIDNDIYMKQCSGTSKIRITDVSDIKTIMHLKDRNNAEADFRIVILLGDNVVDDFSRYIRNGAAVTIIKRVKNSDLPSTSDLAGIQPSVRYAFSYKGDVFISDDASFENFPVLSYETGIIKIARFQLFKIKHSLSSSGRKNLYQIVEYRLSNNDVHTCFKNTDLSEAYIRNGRIAIIGGRDRIVKIPLSNSSLSALKRAEIGAHIIRDKLPDRFKIYVPELLSSHIDSIPYYSIESRCNGVLASAYRFHPFVRKKIVNQAAKLIEEIHHETACIKNIDEDDFEGFIGNKISYIQDKVPDDVSGILHRIEDSLRRSLVGRKIPLTMSHGDYWLGNLIVSRENQGLKCVIDWSDASLKNLPLLDLLHLVATQRKEFANKYFGIFFLYILIPFRFRTWEKKIISSYMKRLEIPKKLWLELAICYWIYRCYLWLTIDVKDPNNLDEREKRWIYSSFYKPALFLSKRFL